MSPREAYFESVGEHINVLSDQNVLQSWTPTVSNSRTLTLQFELVRKTTDATLGLYNAGEITPALYPLFPPVAAAGWFAVASFRNAPTRLVVSVFDANASPQGSQVYPGADRNRFGLYIQGPGGTFFTQDGRNPGGDPQALVFAGTGLNSGNWWLAWEDLPLNAGADWDFDDEVMFMESASCFTDCTPTRSSTWGQVKAYYR